MPCGEQAGAFGPRPRLEILKLAEGCCRRLFEQHREARLYRLGRNGVAHPRRRANSDGIDLAGQARQQIA
jgi:hypothetical protein